MLEHVAQTDNLVFPRVCTDTQDSGVLEVIHEQSQLASLFQPLSRASEQHHEP